MPDLNLERNLATEGPSHEILGSKHQIWHSTVDLRLVNKSLQLNHDLTLFFGEGSQPTFPKTRINAKSSQYQFCIKKQVDEWLNIYLRSNRGSLINQPWTLNKNRSKNDNSEIGDPCRKLVQMAWLETKLKHVKTPISAFLINWKLVAWCCEWKSELRCVQFEAEKYWAVLQKLFLPRCCKCIASVLGTDRCLRQSPTKMSGIANPKCIGNKFSKTITTNKTYLQMKPYWTII